MLAFDDVLDGIDERVGLVDGVIDLFTALHTLDEIGVEQDLQVLRGEGFRDADGGRKLADDDVVVL